jgi:hypothetical protein
MNPRACLDYVEKRKFLTLLGLELRLLCRNQFRQKSESSNEFKKCSLPFVYCGHPPRDFAFRECDAVWPICTASCSGRLPFIVTSVRESIYSARLRNVLMSLFEGTWQMANICRMLGGGGGEPVISLIANFPCYADTLTENPRFLSFANSLSISCQVSVYIFQYMESVIMFWVVPSVSFLWIQCPSRCYPWHINFYLTNQM